MRIGALFMQRWVCVCFSSVLCRVYVTIDSYVSVRTHSEVSVQELLSTVAERLDCAEDDMVLMAVTYPGGLSKFIHLSIFISIDITAALCLFMRHPCLQGCHHAFKQVIRVQQS